MEIVRSFTSLGYLVPFIQKQLFHGFYHPPALHHPRLPQLSLITIYYPGLLHLKRIHREGFHILSLDPSTQDLLTKSLSVTFRKLSNLHQLIVNTSLHPTVLPSSLLPTLPRCKTCPIHHPANSFTSSRTNVTYPITTHADCKSMNLIYQL